MPEEFKIEQRWPDLFEPLDEAQRRAVLNTLASSWHEGWEPNRSDVSDLVDYTLGTIDEAEYDRRTEISAAAARDA